MAENLDKILYIDDEENNLLLFELNFNELYNVFTTTSTKKAREYLKSENIKVVVCDLRMPEEMGLDFIRSVSPEYPDINFIVLTAFSDVETVLKALNNGNISRYHLKPWDANEINLSISNAILNYNLKTENKKLFKQLQEKNKGLENALTQLKERELQFYNIFHFSSDGILIFDTDGKILLTNPVVKDFIKNSGRDVSNVKDLLKGPNLMQFNSRVNAITKKPTSTVEYEIPFLSGEIKYIEANSTIIEFRQNKVYLSFIRDITERKQMENRILNEVIQAEERERNRLASDLHDGLGPVLSTLKMYIEWLSDKTRTGNVDQILELSAQSIHEAISQLRTISHNISPHILDKFGLVPAIQSQVDMLKATSQIDFRIYSDLKDRLPHLIEMALFRIIKECLNNTVKHSGANKVFIDIIKDNNILNINYTDDGSGFDAEKVFAQNKGMGLYNIKNRIKSLQGDVDIISEPGKGTHVKITINF
jgi:PAS domain S-box-containing protein